MIEDIPLSSMILSSGAKDTDRATLYLLSAVERAVEDAGLEPGCASLRKALFIAGTSLGGVIKGAAYHEDLLARAEEVREGKGSSREWIDPCQCTYYGPAIAVSRRFGIEGGLIVVNTGCTSSSHALAMGVDFIRSGRYKLVIVGGNDALSPFVYSGFNCLGILKDKPFDPDTKGLLLGEGAGAVVLEEMNAKREKKQGPQVFLSGYGAHLGILSTVEKNGLEKALRSACEDASFTSRDIDLINGQSLENSIEASRHYPALKSFFGKSIGTLGFFSLKSFIGHTLGASGIFDCITSYLIMKKGEIPAGLAANNASQNNAKAIKAILTTESAFGGNHVALIVSKTKGRAQKHESKRVVITGRGGIASKGRAYVEGPLTPNDWRILVPLADGSGSDIEKITTKIKDRWVTETSNLSRMDRFCRLSILGAYLALMDSGLSEDTARRKEMGTVFGSAFGCLLSNEKHHRDLILKGPRRVSPLLFPYTLPSSAPSEIGMVFGFEGPAIALTTGWSAGLQSIGLALELIRLARTKRLLAGGVDCLGKILIQGLEDSGIERALSPLSEGIGILCLEEMEDAQTRRAPILGEILGFGTSFCPTGSNGDTGGGVKRAVAQALEDALISLQEIDVIFLAPGPTGLLARVKKALLSLIPEKKGMFLAPSFQDEAFAATAPLILCVDGIGENLLSGGEPAPGRNVLTVSACPRGTVACLIIRA
jgi:3-oxoacyl-[acyl-carrier-protein] synthase II